MEGEGSGGGPEGEGEGEGEGQGEGVFTKILDAPCRSKLIVTSCTCRHCIRLACMRCNHFSLKWFQDTDSFGV